ncbi:MAG: hypothetical protein ACPG5U_03850 [Planktomarina sp.]
MYANPIVGASASARKYDILTALGAKALAGNKHEQRLILRLITLLTARYNWRIDRLVTAQAEIAKLWACDERTVKRVMAQYRALGWFVTLKQGCRGRIAEYRLDQFAVLRSTRPMWDHVGPDFVARLEVAPAPVESNVVPFTAPDITPTMDGSVWSVALLTLHAEDVALYAAWFKDMIQVKREGSRLTLKAPTRFAATYVQTHLMNRVMSAVRAADADVMDVRCKL